MRIAVLGAELEGLLAAWVLSQHPGVTVDVIESRDAPVLGDELPSLIHTPSASRLMAALGAPFTGYTPKTGILLRERVQRWPRHLRTLPRDEAVRVVLDLSTKTSRALTMPPAGSVKIPRHRPAPRRLRFDTTSVKALLWPADQIRRGDWRVSEDRVILGRRYDRVVLTAPMWQARERVPLRLPRVTTARRTVVTVVPRGAAQIAQWDTVLLPYTPHDRAVRTTLLGTTIAVEFAGALRWTDVIGEINYLCRDGGEVVAYRDNLPGVPYPAHVPTWPAWLVPLGTFAAWKPTTLDAVLDQAYALLRAWMMEEDE